jgi:hypothetical protein
LNAHWFAIDRTLDHRHVWFLCGIHLRYGGPDLRLGRSRIALGHHHRNVCGLSTDGADLKIYGLRISTARD